MIAVLKYYILSCELQTGAFYEVIQKDTIQGKSWGAYAYEQSMPLYATYVFACLFFGNLIDNHNEQNHHRRMIIISSLVFGSLCLLKAWLEMLWLDNLDGRAMLRQCLKSVDYGLQFTGTGVYMIVLLQVFNWFAARRIHWVMALWTMTQGLGTITWIVIDRRYNYIKLLIIGPCFILLALYDYFFFTMHPAQENIFVEDAR
mmetsp:Transcript_29851/g.37018  ORF Transcript_29851/g.37018 Transcript_29851/m.37018 type:complete len:202 (+) Transcript_29851:1-606(+)